MNNTRIDDAIAAALRDPKRGLRLLETVAAHANDAILITEVDEADGSKIVYANEAFERMSGYSAADVYGKTPRFMQGPSTSRESVAKIHDALRAWRSITIEMLNYSRAGHPFWVELNIVPVANDAGRFTHWISIQRNVSDRHAARALAIHAEFLEAQNALLSREIGERERVAARLEFSSSHDALTGLSNRSHFIEHVARSLVLGQASP